MCRHHREPHPFFWLERDNAGRGNRGVLRHAKGALEEFDDAPDRNHDEDNDDTVGDDLDRILLIVVPFGEEVLDDAPEKTEYRSQNREPDQAVEDAVEK